MESYEAVIRQVLEQNGCTFVKRGEGSYDIWLSAQSGKHFPVDDSIKSRRHANTILRLSGVNYQV